MSSALPEIWALLIKRVKIVHWHLTSVVLCHLRTTTILTNFIIFKAEQKTFSIIRYFFKKKKTQQITITKTMHTEPENEGCLV